MLSKPQRMGSGSIHYFLNTSQSQREFDPTQKGEPAGYWLPTLEAARMGLKGIPNSHEFRAIFSQEESTYEIPGITAAFCAPKSISILWAVTNEETKSVIEAAHTEAVEIAVKYLEEQFNQLENRSTKELVTPWDEKQGLLVAGFLQGSSRQGSNERPDPLLHTHILVRNLDKTIRSTESKVLYEHYRVAGAIYRAELAHKLQQELGVQISREKSWFELRGFSREKGKYQELMNHFSSRRQQIEATGAKTAKETQIAAFKTRKGKDYQMSHEELFQYWEKEAQKFNFGRKQAQALIEKWQIQKLLPKVWHDWRIIKEGVKNTIRYQSHFTRHELLQHMAVASQGRGYDFNQVKSLTERYLESRKVEDLGVIEGKQRFANKRMYQQEQKLMALTKNLHRNERSYRISPRYIQTASPGLNLEQKEALKKVCQQGQIKTITGISGSGKTTLLKAVGEVHRKQGYQLVAISTSKLETKNLQQKTGIGEQSIFAKALGLKPKDKNLTFHHFEWLIKKKLNPLNRKTLVVVDNAQKLSVTQFTKLLKEVNKAKCKIILAGDTSIKQAYEHAGAFKAISRLTRGIKLEEVQRQELLHQREILRGIEQDKALENGMLPEQIFEALTTMHENGQLQITKEESKAVDCVVNDWMKNKGRKLSDYLVIADNQAEVEKLNHKIQNARIANGEVSATMVRVGEAKIAEGDLIEFGKNSSTYNLTKGELGTVKQIDRITKLAFVKLESGKSTIVNMRHYKDVSLGYAATPTTAQHREVKHSLVLTRGIAKEGTMVQLSRASLSTKVYSWVDSPECIERIGDREVINERKAIGRLGVKMGWEHGNELAIEKQKIENEQER